MVTMKEHIKMGFNFAIFMITLPIYIWLLVYYFVISVVREIITKVWLYNDTGTTNPSVTFKLDENEPKERKPVSILKSTSAPAPAEKTVKS